MNAPPTLPGNARATLHRLADGSVPWEVTGLTLERYLFDHPPERALVASLNESELEDLLSQMMAGARDYQAEDAKYRLAAYLDEHRFELEARARPTLEPVELAPSPALLAPTREPVGVEH